VTQNFTLTVLPQPTPPNTPALTTSDPDGVIQPGVTVTVSGSVPLGTDAGDTIKIFDDNGATQTQVGTGTVAQYASGISIGTLSAGSHSITATATDSIGNVSQASGGLVLTVPGAISAAFIGS